MAKEDAGHCGDLLDSSSTSAAGADMTFRIMKALQAAGHKVQEASDGTTYVSYRGAGGTTGAVVITHYSTGAGGYNNTSAWFVVSDPLGGREYLYQRGASGRTGTLAISKAAGFVGGTPNATTRSTAADEQVMVNNSNLWSNSSGNKYFQGCAETTPTGDVYPFWFWQTVTSSTTMQGGFAIEPMAPGSFDPADTDPCVYIWGDNNGFGDWSAMATEGGGTNDGAYGFDAAGNFVKMWGLSQNSNNLGARYVPGYGTHDLGVNPYSGKDEGLRILFARGDGGDTSAGVKGQSQYLRWPAVSRSWADTFTLEDGTRWAYAHPNSVSGLLIPYMDAVVPTHGVASVDYDGVFLDPLGEGDVTNPVVANFSPPAGSVLERNQAVSFDVTDDSGLFARVLVLAIFTTGLWEVVHDGDAFSPAYVAASARSAIGSGYHFSVVRGGGWFADPTIRVIPIDASGNEP